MQTDTQKIARLLDLHAGTLDTLKTAHEALVAIDHEQTLERAARIELEGEVERLGADVAELGLQVTRLAALVARGFAAVTDGGHSVKVGADS